jgi:DNA-binding LytR/AlgR family response regulator
MGSLRLAWGAVWARTSTPSAACNAGCADEPEDFVSDAAPHFTLRRMRDHFARPLTPGLLAVAAGVAALTGPFGTEAALRPVPRLGFWGLHVVATCGAGSAVWLAAERRLAALPRCAMVGLQDALTGLAAAGLVLLINWTVLGWTPPPDEAAGFAATVAGIALLVTVAIALAASAMRPAEATAPAPLLSRLPVAKRGALLSLSAEDHYVRVRTAAGEEMVLMRLADAVAEVGATTGLQVHRSHWVATAAVRDARREGDRAVLTLTGGIELPVSRRHVPDVRAAGLLPGPAR